MSSNNGSKIEFRRLHTLTGIVHLKTGLHIGAGRESVEIGGLDGPVIKHPHTGRPYIPGSSLKGKLRSLLEWACNKVQDDGLPYGSASDRKDYSPDDPILRLFGCASKHWTGGPTRLIVRDAELSPDWVGRMLEAGLDLTEQKTEVVIDRLQGKAAGNIGPRTMERVPAGAVFQLEMTIREYSVNGDGGRIDRQALNWLVTGLKLLEHDALGGSGSRGYGRVRIEKLSLDGSDIQAKFDQIGPLVRPDTPPIHLFEE